MVLFSSLSPFRWPQNMWTWMTLNSLKSHFTSYVHYYELPRTNYLLLIYCSLFIKRVTMACDQRRSAGRGVAKSDLQNIGIHGKYADLPWTLYRRNLNKFKITPTLLYRRVYYLVPYRLTGSKTRDFEYLESPFCVKFCFVPVYLELWSMAFGAWLLLNL